MKERPALLRQTAAEIHERLHTLIPLDWEETLQTSCFEVLHKLRLHQDFYLDWQKVAQTLDIIKDCQNERFEFDAEDFWKQYQRYILDLIELGWDFERGSIPGYILEYSLRKEMSVQSFHDVLHMHHNHRYYTPQFIS
jgi:hypothetical protein